MNDAERRGPVPVRASELHTRGATEELSRVVKARLERGLCLECGTTKSQDSLCEKCAAQFPQRINVGEPVDGWQYRILLNRPEFFGLVYIERVDAFPPERRGKVELVVVRSSIAEAKEYIEKRIARAWRSGIE